MNTRSCSLSIFFFYPESLLTYIHVETAELKATLLFQTITCKQEIGQLPHATTFILFKRIQTVKVCLAFSSLTQATISQPNNMGLSFSKVFKHMIIIIFKPNTTKAVGLYLPLLLGFPLMKARLDNPSMGHILLQ